MSSRNLAVLSETSGSAGRDQAVSIAQGHGGVPVGVGPGRSAMRSILLAMKSFSCNPLILVLRETVVQRGGRRRKGGIRAAARAFGLTRHRLGLTTGDCTIAAPASIHTVRTAPEEAWHHSNPNLDNPP